MPSSWDASELEQLAADMDRSVIEVVGKLRGIWSKAGVNIKTQMANDLRGSESFFPAAHTVSYDITTPAADTLLLEVGPSHGAGDPGSLANIAYFGTSRGGATVDDPLGALEAEEARTIVYVEQLLGGLL